MKNLFFFSLIIPSYVIAGIFTPMQMARLAEERAPLIKMQLEQKSAAFSQISQSRLFANPVLAIQSGSLKSGTQSGSIVDVTLNQPVPWPGKRFAEINSAKILERITDSDLEESRLFIYHSVSLLSIELAVLSELEKHHEERKQRFSIIHKFLTTRPMASPKQVVEKNLIETQIKLVEGQMFDLETKKRSLIEQLEQLSGEKDLSININWHSISSPAAKSIYSTVLENSPRFKRSKQLEELALNKIEQAKYLAKPDILVGVNYRQENIAPTNHFYHANLAIVIPIVDRGQHSVEIARAQARREEANKKMVMLESTNSLNRSYQALISAYKSTELFKISDLKKVDKQFHEAEDAFKKGRIDVTTFLQTDTQIHDSIDLAYMSFIKYFTALSEVKMLTGQKMEMQ